jgi:hypothetical protein
MSNDWVSIGIAVLMSSVVSFAFGYGAGYWDGPVHMCKATCGDSYAISNTGACICDVAHE